MQEQFSDYHGMEAPGTYELSTSMTPEEMLQIMAADTSEESDSDSSTQKSSGSPSESTQEENGSQTDNTEESNGG